jgi:predicted transcriptional regulator
MSLVEDYVSTKMVSRTSAASMVEISKAMADWKISSIAITDEQNKCVIGILTERDVVNSIAKGAHPERINAGSLMSAPVVSIRNDLPIEEAARVMLKKKVRHLLVEDACHGVVGIITTTDLARYLKKRTERENTSEGQRNSTSDELLSEVWELFF